ncbi:serine/threonine-protein kinase pakA-like [Leptopilina boulardi]|uniref:serine/threonine-protein kinase pakA-like n=1 Tax=Leptopilina boulardi TaxID=63433 RepID=UPI0021F630F8|nr:serine/threonine-protein kinase pakA-like [Leptopilina boulardi]XP_051157495.1 serine/threonine-protein kinase pakA-like [Leptopilina boulardi]
MMAATCCVCRRHLSKEIDKKNIFKNSLVIKSNLDKTEEKCTSSEKMRLYSAIELIIGRKLSKSKGSQFNICDQCYRKLEDLINFRAQMLISFGTTFQEQNSCLSMQEIISNSKREKPEEYSKDNYLNFNETSNCPKQTDNQLVSDDLINVDENSDSIDFTTIYNYNENKNDLKNSSKLKTDQRNNNLNDSDSSNDNIDVLNCVDSPTRILKNDIESDIDVCSGEDDEILEIEATKRNVILKESENSSDSEIEVCDYEPIGKRTRNFSAVHSSINI